MSSLKKQFLQSSIVLVMLAGFCGMPYAICAESIEHTKPILGDESKREACTKEGVEKIITKGEDEYENPIVTGITYNFGGKDHIFRVTNADGVSAALTVDYEFNNIDKSGHKGTIHIYQKNDLFNPFEKVNGINPMSGKTVKIDSNLDITATSDYASVGITVGNGTNLIINGNVKMRKDDPQNPWGVITKNIHGNVGVDGAVHMNGQYDYHYSGARWQPSGIGTFGPSDSKQGKITINGDVDIAVRGTAVQTGTYSGEPGVSPYDLSVFNLLGQSNRIVTPDNDRDEKGNFKEGYFAIASYGGTVNINVKDGQPYRQDGKVEVVGNVIVMERPHDEYSDKKLHPDTYQNGKINMALMTKDSFWKGVVDNAGKVKWVAYKIINVEGYESQPKAVSYTHLTLPTN